MLDVVVGLPKGRLVGRLDHQIALVTGGASGLGKAVAQRLALEGARVVITDVQVSLGQALARECGLTFVQQDVTDETQWRTVVSQIQTRHGGLHILVNNAGILGPRDAVSPEETRLADWQRIFAVNVEGVFLGCRSAIPAMHASGGGSIINISSIAALLATPHAAAYGASKAAVRHLTKSVAQHCVERKLKIRCNSLHPGDVRTPMFDSYATEVARDRGVPVEEILKDWQSTIPMGSFIELEDVANAVVFLASDDSRHMTGAKLVIDGGSVHCDTYHRRILREKMDNA